MANSSPPASAMAGFGPGSQVSDYLLERQIGRGGMAAVFVAHDERLNRQVALKILAPILAADDGFRQRFMAESRAAAAVEDPNIIPVYEAGEASGVLFIAMRLVRGGDVRTLVARQGSLPAARACRILSAVASALDTAHAAGLVHRDVKPANMLLDTRPGRADHVYLSDFGISKASLASSDLTGSGQFLGTVDYAAPEQIHGQPVDGRADQYSLGCSAFELLCGHPPFFGKQMLAAMYSHLSTAPPSLASSRPELPPEVDAVFARVLAKSPADRYDSCQAFASALSTALGVPGYAPEGQADAVRPAGTGEAAEDDSTLAPAAVGRLAARSAGHSRAGQESAAGNGPEAGTLLEASGWTQPRATSQVTVGGMAAGPEAPPNRSRRVLVSVVTVLVLIAAAATALLVTRRPQPSPSARYVFASQSYPGDLALTQLWKLTRQDDGSVLDVTITVRNATSNSVSAQLQEPIPATIAPSLQAVSFPGRAVPVLSGRLATWDLPINPDSDAVVSYQVREPAAGSYQAKLRRLVGDFAAVDGQQSLHAEALRSVWISPLDLQVQVGQTGVLTVHGRLLNGKVATGADLAGAVWSSANPAVLRVSRSGVVTGVSAGTTLITVQLGTREASATVVVNGSAGLGPPPAYSPPPVQSSSSPSSSASPSPSDSVSPSPSPSPSSSAGTPSPSPSGGLTSAPGQAVPSAS